MSPCGQSQPTPTSPGRRRPALATPFRNWPLDSNPPKCPLQSTLRTLHLTIDTEHSSHASPIEFPAPSKCRATRNPTDQRHPPGGSPNPIQARPPTSRHENPGTHTMRSHCVHYLRKLESQIESARQNGGFAKIRDLLTPLSVCRCMTKVF